MTDYSELFRDGGNCGCGDAAPSDEEGAPTPETTEE